MKKCDHYKDLILTDYVDGQLDKDCMGEVDGHLLECSDCREFLKEVKKNMILLNLSPQPVPAELWDTIRQRIEQEDQKIDPLADFIGKIKELVVFPRMIPIFASLTLMFFVGSVTLNNIEIQQSQAKDQGEYLVSLLDPAGSSENNDPGTPIEHYFL